MNNQPASPVARAADLIITEVGDDLIVYDELSSQFHLLERDAATVWRAADGSRTADDLGVSTGIATSEVEAILDRLSTAELLAKPPTRHEAPRLISRRQALARVGLAAGVFSMVAPLPAAAQSPTCVPFNQCTQQTLGQTCCDTSLICGHDMRDNVFHCFAPVFCDDPDFWQVQCWPS